MPRNTLGLALLLSDALRSDVFSPVPVVSGIGYSYLFYLQAFLKLFDRPF